MALPTGGTIWHARVGGVWYRGHTFDLASTDDFVIPAGLTLSVEHFIVGAGGGTLKATEPTIAGGAGGGGVIENVGSPVSRSAGTFPVTVGEGRDQLSGSYGDSSIFGLTAICGGSNDASANGQSGGSGAGAGFKADGTFVGSIGTGTAGQGNDGGGVLQFSSTEGFAGHGGGASFDGSAGSDFSLSGVGFNIDFDGLFKYYGSGGRPQESDGVNFEEDRGRAATDTDGADGAGGGAGAAATGRRKGGHGVVKLRYPATEVYSPIDVTLATTGPTPTLAGTAKALISGSTALSVSDAAPVSASLTASVRAGTALTAPAATVSGDLAVAVSGALSASGDPDTASGSLTVANIAALAITSAEDPLAATLKTAIAVQGFALTLAESPSLAMTLRQRQYAVALKGAWRAPTPTGGKWRAATQIVGRWRGTTQITGKWRRANVGEHI